VLSIWLLLVVAGRLVVAAVAVVTEHLQAHQSLLELLTQSLSEQEAQEAQPHLRVVAHQL